MTPSLLITMSALLAAAEPAAPGGSDVAAMPKKGITARDREHWAFRPLHPASPPAVRNEAWCRTTIDRFALARLEEQGLTPNPPADRHKLIRRAYFDLVGMPLSPDAVEAFVADRDPQAFATVVDRLLASPHFGERWARHWLDVARFAESHGFEQDYDRKYAYHYRDFVIRAFNRDMPYDRFVRWQLAGDEIAPHDPLALMATGFLGAGVFPTQITANEVERTRYDALDDMAATMGTAMLGLTVGCARCHDHKYDPIPAYDYYRLVSTFTTTVRTNVKLNLQPKRYREAKAEFDRRHAPLVSALRDFERGQLPSRFERWLRRGSDREPAAPTWIVPAPVEYQSQGGAAIKARPDGSLLVGGHRPRFDTYTITVSTKRPRITAVRIEALPDDSLKWNGPGRSDDGGFALTDIRLSARPRDGDGEPLSLKLVNPRASFAQNDRPVAKAIDDDKKSAWAVYPQVGVRQTAAFDCQQPVSFAGGARLTFTLQFESELGSGLGCFRLSIASSDSPDLDADTAPQSVLDVLAGLKHGDPQLSDAHQELLLEWYRTLDPQWRALNQKVRNHLYQAPRPELTNVMICTEGEGVIPMRHHTQGADFFEKTYFLNRGDVNAKQGVATQSFLQVLMSAPEGEKRWQVSPPRDCRTSYRRRSLANWITDTQAGAGHLLARVIVNRLWQHHLGRGIVATPNDFGRQGERPTHPELLDWLAAELIHGGWRLKPLHKLIMTSSVYIQSADFDRSDAAADPENRWLWRYTPRRLEAEPLRDALLAISGRLDPTMFGPGTLNENHPRRSIYFMIKRSKLIPCMQLFDAPEPLTSIGQRPSTTVAPQALMFMNDVNIRRCAEGFAKRLRATAGSSDAEAVRQGYRIALAREPDAAELDDAMGFIQSQTDSYAEDADGDAHELALTDFCQVLMSLNEFIYID